MAIFILRPTFVGPAAASPAILDKCDLATLRTTLDGTPIFQVYQGEGQTQVGSLDTALKAFKTHLTVIGSSAVYIYGGVQATNNAYTFPGAFMRSYLESGTWDPTFNRLTFWAKSSVTIVPEGTGHHSVEFGTYIKQHDCTSDSYQGSHYYHFLNGPWGPNWTYCVINAHPQHRRAADGSINWPVEPEYTSFYLIYSGYETGTCTLTHGSPNVVGSGTAFMSDFSPGNVLHFDVDDPTPTTYDILSNPIPDDTHLTLDANYAGPTTTVAHASRVEPLPQPSQGSINGPLYYFDGMCLFYVDGQDPTAFSVPMDFWVTDFEFSKVTNEPDYLVSSVCCYYDGTKYTLTWSTIKNISQTYTMYYSSAGPMKNPDGTWNGTGTSAGTVTNSGDANVTVIMSTPALAEQSTMWFFILPTGSSLGTEIVKVRKT